MDLYFLFLTICHLESPNWIQRWLTFTNHTQDMYHEKSPLTYQLEETAGKQSDSIYVNCPKCLRQLSGSVVANAVRPFPSILLFQKENCDVLFLKNPSCGQNCLQQASTQDSGCGESKVWRTPQDLYLEKWLVCLWHHYQSISHKCQQSILFSHPVQLSACKTFSCCLCDMQKFENTLLDVHWWLVEEEYVEIQCENGPLIIWWDLSIHHHSPL